MSFDFIVHMKMIETEALDHGFLNLVLLPMFPYPRLMWTTSKYIHRGGFALIEVSFHFPHHCAPISVDSFKDRKTFVPFSLEFTVNDVKSNTGVILVLI